MPSAGPSAQHARPEEWCGDDGLEPQAPHQRQRAGIEADERWRAGEADVPLNPVGVAQAELIAEQRAPVLPDQVDVIEVERVEQRDDVATTPRATMPIAARGVLGRAAVRPPARAGRRAGARPPSQKPLPDSEDLFDAALGSRRGSARSLEPDPVAPPDFETCARRGERALVWCAPRVYAVNDIDGDFADAEPEDREMVAQYAICDVLQAV